MSIKKQKFIFIMIVTIIISSVNKSSYAQVKIDDKQNQTVYRTVSEIKDALQSEDLKSFTVDNNTYKILNLSENYGTVMFWKCENLDASKKIIVNNEVSYNGQDFKIIYVYEKAFYNSDKNVNEIVIGDDVLGFCDSSGNLIKTLNYTFKDEKELKNIDFGNTNFVFGENCFQNCKAVVNIEIPKDMSIMEDSCFDKCYCLKKIDLSGIIKFKGKSSFANCSGLENIGQLNDEVIELPEKTFISCYNLKINSLNNVTKLGNECFSFCRVLNENIITDIKEIGDKCFWGCGFKEVYLKGAEKIGYNAFGKCGSLEKIRFGNPNIPNLADNIVEYSTVNEWVYPLSYKNQSDYLNFLSKLKVSKVIWDCNYGDQKREVTYENKLNTLKVPTISRSGYELEGWYKEPECINKVKMIADLGKIVDSDIVIKDPILYAKWTVKSSSQGEVNIPSDSKESIDVGEKDNSSDSKEPIDEEDKDNPSDSKEPIDEGEKNNPSDSKEPIDLDEKDNSSDLKEPMHGTKTNNSTKSYRSHKNRNKILKFDKNNKQVNLLPLENEIINYVIRTLINRSGFERNNFNWLIYGSQRWNWVLYEQSNDVFTKHNNKIALIYITNKDSYNKWIETISTVNSYSLNNNVGIDTDC